MAKYQAAANLANSLIGAKGAVVTFTRVSGGTYNPVTQVNVGASTLTFSMKGVDTTPGKGAEFRIGSLASRNILELHLAPNLGETPFPGDKVRWQNADWTVIWSGPLNPAGDGAPYCLVYAER